MRDAYFGIRLLVTRDNQWEFDDVLVCPVVGLRQNSASVVTVLPSFI